MLNVYTNDQFDNLIEIGTVETEEDVREKLSIANKGKIVSEETKMKQSLQRRGENNANNKLSKETVFNIYNELSSGVHYMDVCKKYGICVSTCYKIKRKEYWCFDK